MTEASGEAQESSKEGQAVPALALEAEMASPVLRGTGTGRTRAQGTEAQSGK